MKHTKNVENEMNTHGKSNPSPNSRRPRAGAWTLLALFALSAPLVVSCGGGEHGPPTQAEKPAIRVAVDTAAQTSWSEGLEVTAGLLPLYRATPGAMLMGRVDEVLRDEGDVVRRGDMLARVESRDVAARLAQAEAAVAAARAMERNALLMKERMERLHARDSATRKNLDDAIAGYDAAQANLRAAEEGVKVAQVYVGYSDVTAPFDGVITEKRVEVGDTAAPGVPLFVIEDVSRVKVEAELPESAAARFAVGDPVEVLIQGESLPAELTEMLPAADPRSRTVTVRALLDNPGRRLRSGMFARMRLPGEARPVVEVPGAAIVRQGPLAGLFVVGDDGVARLRWVTVGRSRDGRVEVLTGLAPGETYVTRTVPGLEDGRRVEVEG